jgi:hypothetical protein
MIDGRVFDANFSLMKNNQQTAYFNRFSLDLPSEAVTDCSHQGACDDDVEHWAAKIQRPSDITPEALRSELKEYGAWDSTELSDDDANWKRLIWIAAGNIKEENNQ